MSGARMHGGVMNRSVLELAVGGLPFPHGANGEWRYRHAVRPEGATALDRQTVSDFLSYERAHGRAANVIADRALVEWEAWRPPAVRPRPGDFATQCCTHVYPDGCGAALVCHGTPATVARRVDTGRPSFCRCGDRSRSRRTGGAEHLGRAA